MSSKKRKETNSNLKANLTQLLIIAKFKIIKLNGTNIITNNNKLGKH